MKLLLFIIVSQVVILQAANHQEDELDALAAHARQARSIYRRLPVFGLDEVPRDSSVNCQAFCDKFYSKLLKNSLYFQACIGVCATIDECSTVADCVGGTVCINTAKGLGYLCQCPPGYTGDGRRSGDGCIDIDECSSEPEKCVSEATCSNTEGSFICQCPFGFIGDGRSDGNGCTDITTQFVLLINAQIDNRISEAACSSGEADCVAEATCIDSTDGDRYICVCPTGLTGDGRINGSGCMADECSTIADCVENTSCINSVDGFVCLCPPGFIGDGRINGNNCIPNECSTIADCSLFASCSNSIDGFVCTCRPGFEGDGRISGTGCVDIDECSYEPGRCVSEANCSNTEGSFICQCPFGFIGDGRSDRNGCTDIDECSSELGRCDSEATCSNTEGSFICQCPFGFIGDGRSDGNGCTDIDECEDGLNDCVPEAMCLNTEGSFECICPPFSNDTSGREGEGCFAIASIPECGPGDWFSVISFNVSDPNQNCPTNWQERTTPVRTCERPMVATGTPSCSIGFEEMVSRPFTRVAGRAVGYQVGTPDAFFSTIQFGSADLDGHYVDGLSITYSTSLSPTNNHIWTFAAGVIEIISSSFGCPCVNGLNLPDFLQDSYFCESGTPTSTFEFFDGDPLWDGENCEGQCCTGSFATVPTFCTTIEEVEDATIRVRLCTDEPFENENIAVESLEIFVQ